jgi:hypothetical protein
MSTILLILLWLVWAAFLFGGFIFGHPKDEHTRRMPRWTRMASSLVLVIVAGSMIVLTPTNVGKITPFAVLITIGMVFGLAGDLALAELLRVKQPVIAGIAAFGLGHTFYIGAIWWLAGQLGYTNLSLQLGSVLVWLFIGAMGWYIVVYRGGRGNPLIWAALPYALLLSGTAGSATGLALQAGAFIPMAIGAALFLLSDLILAAQLFSGARFRLIDDIVWLTYGPAQMLIVYTISAAWLVAGGR